MKDATNVFAPVRAAKALLVALTVFLLFHATCSVFAQTSTAVLMGTVKDSTGAVIPGVSVTARNVDTNQITSALTGSDGSYRFESLPVGNYDLKAEQAGFKTFVRSGVVLTVAEQDVLNFVLEVGSVSQEVEVNGESPTVNTSNPTLGAVVDEEQVSDLPLNGRNYIQLALLQTGITPELNRTTTASASLGSQGTRYSSNGAPIRSNRYLLDGTNLSEYGFATASSISGTTLGIDGIKEFKILSNNFDAQYGMAMGSQMLVVSKSGTNQVHGDVFGYLRNSALDARNYFDTTATAGFTAEGAQRRLPPFRRINMGGAVGGPIRKNKAFLFGVYEGIRELQGTTQLTTAIPAGCRGSAGQTIIAGSGTGECPFLTSNTKITTTNAAIPLWLATSGPNGLAPIFPLPNDGPELLSWSYGAQTQEDYGQGRFDQTFSDKDNMFFRYTVDNDQTSLPGAVPGFPTHPISLGQWGTLAENHIFSSNLLNNATFGYSRANLHLGGEIYENGPGYGFLSNGPSYETGAQGFEMGSIAISGGGTAGGAGTTVSQGLQSVYSYSDDLYYTHGHHALKFGTLINHYDITAINAVGTTGSISFNSYALFLAGAANSYSFDTPGFEDRLDIRFDTLGFYVQDDDKISPTLTLNFGFRYEPNTNMVEIHGHAASVRNFLTDSQPTVGRLMMQDPSWHNFSPRFGFAWDPWGNGKTSFRGGASYAQNVAAWLGAAHVAVKQLPLENPITITAASSAVGEQFTIPFTIPSVLPATTRSPTLYEYYSNGQLPAAPGNQQPRGLYYNLSVQRQLPSAMVLTAAYTGSRNWGLLTKDLANVVYPTGVPGVDASGHETCVKGPSGINPADQYYTDGKANACYFTAPTGSGLASDTWFNQNWGNITAFEASGQSWYNSLQVALDKKLTRGLQFQEAFTWSRLLDTTETQAADDGGFGTSGFVLDPIHPERDRGPADFNVPVTFRFNILYTVPNLHVNRLVNGVENGWRVSSIFQAQSGSAFDLGLGTSRSLPTAVGMANDRPDVYAGRNPHNMTHGVSTGCAAEAAGTQLGTVATYYDPCAFYVQPLGFEGNMSRDMLRGPDYQTLDLSLVKDTKAPWFGEAGAVEFRAEMFNILNRANFATPGRTPFKGNGPSDNDVNETLETATSASITQTISPSRQIQLVLKVMF